MPGTLVITTLSDGTNSTSATNAIQGSAKAWVNFNGTTSPGTIRAQYNVSSVTKNGTGDYTVNFTNAMTDANYSGLVMQGSSRTSSAGGASGVACESLYAVSSASGYRFLIGDAYSTFVFRDQAYVTVAIFR